VNRTQEIDLFLKNLGKMYLQNPSVPICSDTVYSELMQYDLTKEEWENRKLNGYFEAWIKTFKNVPNIDVFHTERQSAFLQFQNTKGKGCPPCAKLYLSFNKNDLYDSVNKIFNYIAKRNFHSYSKVADRIRADSVVLRMGELDAAKETIEAINNNPELSKKAKKTNPFLYRSGVVGIGYDDNTSYNSIVSELVEKYLKKCRRENTLQNVSYQDFRVFIINEYNKNFTTQEGVKAFSESYEMANATFANNLRMDEKLLNLEQVYKTLILSLDPKTTLDTMFEHLKNCQDPYKRDCTQRFFQKSLSFSEQKNDTINFRNIVNDFIIHICKTRGYGQVKLIFNHVYNGEYEYVTRTNDFRNLFMKYISPQTLHSIVGNDIDLYERNLMNNINSQNLQENINKKQLFDSYLQCNLNKYGYEKTLYQINLFMGGEINAITRTNNYRVLFHKYMTPQDINLITNGNITSYVNAVYQFQNPTQGTITGTMNR